MTFLLYVLVVLLFVSGSYRIAKTLPVGSLTFPERAALSFLASWYFVYLAVSVFGVVRLDWVLAAGIGVILIAGATIGAQHFFSDGKEWLVCFRAEWAAAGWVGRALILAVFAVGCAGLLQGMAPPNTFDSLSYHLALPKGDVEAGFVGVPWERNPIFAFFPAYGPHLSRIALIIDPTGDLAQLMHGSVSLFGAVGVVGLARRIGVPAPGGALAALLFLGNRVVVWQMGSTEVDAPLASLVALSLMAYLAWHQQRHISLAVLFGVLSGLMVVVKYHGLVLCLAFAPFVLWHLIQDRFVNWRAISLAVGSATLIVLPHIVRNTILVGNPLFPLFNQVFNPDQVLFFEDINLSFGTGRRIVDLILAPWMLSIHPMTYFDGMMMGTPYLLALAPLALMHKRKLNNCAPLVVTAFAYGILWFWLLSQQVRFLMHILPVLAVFSSIGLLAMYAPPLSRFVKVMQGGLIGVLVLGQGMFVAAYALLRLPPALGLANDAYYLSKTPTMDGAFYEECRYISDNLHPSERYFSLLTPHSFYCPQANAVVGDVGRSRETFLYPHKDSAQLEAEVARAFVAADFRLVVIGTAREDRLNKDGKRVLVPVSYQNSAVGKIVAEAVASLAPLKQGKYAAVYDGQIVKERISSRWGISSRHVR